MKPSLRMRQPIVLLLMLLCAFPAGCGKKAAPPPPPPTAPPTAAPDTSARASGATATEPDGPPSWISNPQSSPGTTVLAAVDPHDMTPTERQFGRAPKRSPDVDYKPDVIVMEEGDKAIKSVASNGITWTFDANAPHVNEFEEGKIVFATGRAVGRVTALKRNGNTVSLVLGPVLLTDLIERGRFVMDQPIDPDKIISYVAPDYPGVNDTAGAPTTTSMLEASPGDEETVVVSTRSHGKWIPTSMSRSAGDGSRSTYRRHGARWVEVSRARVGARSADVLRRLEPATVEHHKQGIHGVPEGMPNGSSLRPLNITPAQSVNIDNGNVRVDGVANKTFLGVQYYYYNKQSGLGADASGLITLQAPVVRCVLTFSHGGIDSAGIQIKGAGGVKLRLGSHSPTTTFANMHLTKWVPLDMSIQLGGPVPFSLTFAVMFNINSGFSAKSSVMTAEGEYGFSGGIWAGRAGTGWSVATPTNITEVTNLGRSVAGISVGINSFALSFGIRTTVGVGAFGFNAGVFAQVRFGGGLLLAPNTAMPCRQANIDTFLDTGVGYQTPQWASSAINFFLGAVGAHPIDPVGTLAVGPTVRLFHGFDQIPTGCSGKSG